MKPSLQVRLSQHLSLTPQLQQSIRLLQLSTLELNQEVEQMLAQNPLLETEEDFETRQEPLRAELQVPAGSTAFCWPSAASTCCMSSPRVARRW